MEAGAELAARLEAYLNDLAAVYARWSTWLSESELAAVRHDTQRLQGLAPVADALFGELRQMLGARQRLLDEARQQGSAAADLGGLVPLLPPGQASGLRQRLSEARLQMASLRQLHVAAWVLLSQALQYYSESLNLMTIGNQPHVYQSTPHADTAGGKLLDASL